MGNSLQMMRRYNDHKAQGLCVDCSNPAVQGYVRCARHIEANRKRASEATDEKHARACMKLYGVSAEEYAQLLERQNGGCAICSKSSKELGYRLCVDHDHKTGRVRGLLCRPCNAALGLLEDDLGRICKVIEYLSTNDSPGKK